MSKTRRQHSAEFKSRVALEAMRGIDTINAIAAKYEIHPVQVSQWKKEAESRMAEIFSKKADPAVTEMQARESKLFEKIGKLEYELDWLKKKSDELSRLP